MNRKNCRTILAVLAVFLIALVLAACGGLPYEGVAVNLVTPPWEEGLAFSYLAEAILEQELGFDVTVDSTLDIGDAFASVADGTNDALMDAWLPLHQDYLDEHGDALQELGTIYSGARAGLIVPQYVADDGITSLSDLDDPTFAASVDNEITGIDPGAGLMILTAEELMPSYSIEDNYTLVEGDVDSMRAALDEAVANEDPIVVTAWKPNSIFGAYDLHMLEEDGEEIFAPNNIRIVGRAGLETELPDLTAFLADMELDDTRVGEVINAIDGLEDPSEIRAAVNTWKDANEDVWREWGP